jgi:hypothetical protein
MIESCFQEGSQYEPHSEQGTFGFSKERVPCQNQVAAKRRAECWYGLHILQSLEEQYQPNDYPQGDGQQAGPQTSLHGSKAFPEILGVFPNGGRRKNFLFDLLV